MQKSIRERLGIDANMYFAVVPEWVLDLPVSAQAIRVYCTLRRYADNKTGECYPSRRSIAMRARLSIATLDRCLRELVEHGAVLIERRKSASGDWTSNLYTVLSVPHGVASTLIPPRPVIAATGSSKVDTGTKPNVNNKQELRQYDETEPPTPPTSEGMLELAAQYTDLAERNPAAAPALRRLAARFTRKAKELMPNE